MAEVVDPDLTVSDSEEVYSDDSEIVVTKEVQAIQMTTTPLPNPKWEEFQTAFHSKYPCMMESRPTLKFN